MAALITHKPRRKRSRHSIMVKLETSLQRIAALSITPVFISFISMSAQVATGQFNFQFLFCFRPISRRLHHAHTQILYKPAGLLRHRRRRPHRPIGRDPPQAGAEKTSCRWGCRHCEPRYPANDSAVGSQLRRRAASQHSNSFLVCSPVAGNREEWRGRWLAVHSASNAGMQDMCTMLHFGRHSGRSAAPRALVDMLRKHLSSRLRFCEPSYRPHGNYTHSEVS